jgi:predicted DNA-binding transcriptional regulator AlpA
MQEVQRRLLTRAEVAQLLGVEEKTLANWRTGELANWRTGELANWRTRGFGPQGFRVGKAVRYRDEEVGRWLAAQEAAEAGDGAA